MVINHLLIGMILQVGDVGDTRLSFTVHLANSVFKVHIISHIPLKWMFFFVFVYIIYTYWLVVSNIFYFHPYLGK